ncbi:hypothetical protein ABB02_00842 [Clostridiaceae bacterium JG1575]|nr:hypothetical protein ABB02_00842 [Clostridiaceae bacterium JG1575]
MKGGFYRKMIPLFLHWCNSKDAHWATAFAPLTGVLDRTLCNDRSNAYGLFRANYLKKNNVNPPEWVAFYHLLCYNFVGPLFC